MRFIEVKEIPESKKNKPVVEYHKLAAELEEFIRMNVKYVKVVFGQNEYLHHDGGRLCLIRAANRNGYPIKVVTRGKDLYLIRTDI